MSDLQVIKDRAQKLADYYQEISFLVEDIEELEEAKDVLQDQMDSFEGITSVGIKIMLQHGIPIELPMNKLMRLIEDEISLKYAKIKSMSKVFEKEGENAS